MNQNRLLFIQIQALPPSMHHKWTGINDFVCITTSRKSQGTNPGERTIELKDNCIVDET
jgi:hypothetical protein